MAVSIIGPKFYAWDSDTGKPLAFGKVYTYQAGTKTPKATFTTEGGETENANPVTLNGAGYADIFLSGSYKIVVKDADDVEVWTSDPVSDPSQLQQEWVRQRNITQVNTTTFTVDGELTDEYVEGVAVRVKQDSGFVVGNVVSATYADGKTTVTLEFAGSETITASAIYAERAILTAVSLPGSVQRQIDMRTIYVGSVSELESLSLGEGAHVYMTEDGRAGDFVFKGGDFSSEVALDISQSLYVAASSDPTGASGAFVRMCPSDSVRASWAGVTDDSGISSDQWATLKSYANIGKTVIFDKSVNLNSNLTVDVPGRFIFEKMLKINPDSVAGAFSVESDDVTFVNTKIDMSGVSQTAIRITSGNNFRMEGFSEFKNFVRYCVSASPASQGFYAENLFFKESNQLATGAVRLSSDNFEIGAVTAINVGELTSNAYGRVIETELSVGGKIGSINCLNCGGIAYYSNGSSSIDIDSIVFTLEEGGVYPNLNAFKLSRGTSLTTINSVVVNNAAGHSNPTCRIQGANRCTIRNVKSDSNADISDHPSTNDPAYDNQFINCQFQGRIRCQNSLPLSGNNKFINVESISTDDHAFDIIQSKGTVLLNCRAICLGNYSGIYARVESGNEITITDCYAEAASQIALIVSTGIAFVKGCTAKHMEVGSSGGSARALSIKVDGGVVTHNTGISYGVEVPNVIQGADLSEFNSGVQL